ncbi:hypothetical protein LZ016_06225 [Sphingomonas sp. SM33]|uniref:Uncharacterized protein n=1 Tax=Sphingomonas telluris TaxID=2907998 RepID=A0ABS9VL44_9SPHN|nr:hypothetical protein [Sphingomonas telluris]MCH8615695.1 hypothetical protein [Sphingomonas telluris]
MNASNKAVPWEARAEWLSELGRAIDEAQWLAWRIGVVEGRNAQALELYVQLEMLRAELDAIRNQDFRNLARTPSTAFPPGSDPLRKITPTREGLEE